MASSPVPSRTTSLGQTQRRDAWWLELLPVAVLFGGFGIYATLRAFEGKFYEWGPYLSPFIPRFFPSVGGSSLPPSSFSARLSAFAPPATTTAKPTTAPFFSILRPAPLANPPFAKTIVAKLRFHLSCKTFIATFFISRLFFSASSGTTP